MPSEILTRAARRKAGVPPPSPLFKTVPVPKLPEPNFKPLKPQKVVKKKGGNSSSDDEEDELILWVQCDNKSCRKWRKISPDSKVDLSGHWYCHMHPDLRVRSCKAPEEKWKVSRKRTFTFSRFSPGQLVWAKLSGYPPWPAIVSPDPWSHGGGKQYICEEDVGCIYHVEFLGKLRTHTWIPEEQMEPYHQGVKCSLGATKKTKRLEGAQQEAESFLPLSNKERLEKCEYQKSTVTSLNQKAEAPSITLPQGRGMKCSQQPPKKKRRKTALNDATNVVRPPANTKRSSGCKKVTAVDQKPALFGGAPSHQSGVVVPDRSLFQILATDMPQENALNVLLQSLHQSQQPLGHNNGARVKSKKESGSSTALMQQYPLQLPWKLDVSNSLCGFQLATSAQQQEQQPLLNIVNPIANCSTSKPSLMTANSTMATQSIHAATSTEITSRFGSLWGSAPSDQLILLSPKSKPAHATAKDRVNQTGRTHPNPKISHLSNNLSHTLGSSQIANHNSVKGHSTSLGGPAKVTQASLDLVENRPVQFTQGKRKKSSTVPAPPAASKQRGKRKEVQNQRKQSNHKQLTRASQATQHTIPTYFTSSPLTLLDNSHSAVAHIETLSSDIPADDWVATSDNCTENQLVPEVNKCKNFCQEMETEAHCEMKEIEEMLSLFGSNAPSTTKDSQDKRPNPISIAEQAPEVDFDSLLNEMNHIEGLIQDLSQGQLVPY